jgi:hypothetical protein
MLIVIMSTRHHVHHHYVIAIARSPVHRSVNHHRRAVLDAMVISPVVNE